MDGAVRSPRSGRIGSRLRPLTRRRDQAVPSPWSGSTFAAARRGGQGNGGRGKKERDGRLGSSHASGYSPSTTYTVLSWAQGRLPVREEVLSLRRASRGVSVRTYSVKVMGVAGQSESFRITVPQVIVAVLDLQKGDELLLGLRPRHAEGFGGERRHSRSAGRTDLRRTYPSPY